MTLPFRLLRYIIALAIFFLSLWAWTRHAEVLELIVRERPVLFGRYSQGRAGALLVGTPILWAYAAAFASRRPLRQSLGNATLAVFTTLFALIAFTYLAHFFHDGPRYLEARVDDEQTQAEHLIGEIKHRPPNEVYDLTYVDKPPQARSYPNPPPGYHDVPLRLTSDADGFRNLDALPQYDMLAVGDSFVAGSNVSDDQTWSALLAKATQRTVYNLGVGGSGPPTYMGNYVTFGLKHKPRVALFMIYEGNDFKEDVALDDNDEKPTLKQRLGAHFDMAFKSSPVTKGLRRLSSELFEKLGSTRPVPGYKEKLGFMPIGLHTESGMRYYAFAPKRAVYLDFGVDEFRSSPEWQATAKILEQIIAISHEHGIQPVFIYAPSKPHVVLPFAKDRIPADQLRFFMHFKNRHLPPAAENKQRLFANLDSEQTVVLDFCKTHGVDCTELTTALQRETIAGTQAYYTYDQHWTPDGQAIAAREIEKFLRAKGYL